MNFRRELPAMRTRIVMVAVAVFTVVGVAAFPRIAHAAPTVSVSSPNVTEGHTGTSPVTVTFTLSEDNSGAVSANYSTQDGTATASGGDYVTQTGTVDFAPHETSKQVTFYARGDQVDETDENFKVVITAVTGGAGGVNNFGTVTILDDDQPPGAGVGDSSAAEGTSAGTDKTDMEFTVRLSGPAPAGGVTYTASTRDPQHDTDEVKPGNQFLLAATAGVDYTPLTNSPVTFTAGQTSTKVIVPITRDSIDEYDQYFELSVKSGDAELDWANGKIVDDDALARLDVSDPTPVTEGNTPCGAVAPPQDPCPVMTFTVTRTGATEKRMVVDYATENRSATSGEDYTSRSGSGDPEDPTTDGTGLVFAPGDSSKTVDVPIKGDTKAEADERFVLNLSNPANAQLGDAQAFGLIRNDDGGNLGSVSVSNAPAAAESSGGTPGTSTFTITAVRTGPTDSSNFTVFYQTADGPESGTGEKAIAGSDYVAKSGSVTINYPATTATVPVSLINDSKNEADEFFQLQLTDVSNANITDPVGEAKITDEDAAPTLSIADKPTVTEGTGANPTVASIPVTLSGASGQTVTVDCSTPKPNSGTATMTDDYTETNQKLTFAPGDTSENCDIPVVADSVDENNETVAVALANPTGATISKGAGTLTITDDDAPPTITIDSAPVTEGSSSNSTAVLPVTLSGPSAKLITVNVATANGTATTPSDYTAKNATLTFNPGETTKDFTVTVIADTLNEANETFTATLSNPNANATLGSPSTGTATIEDDDDAPMLSIDNVTVNEGNVPAGVTNATFTVTLQPGSAQTITVHYATADDTATAGTDYTATSGDLSFAPGEHTKTINVPVKGDTEDEADETFSVALSAPTNASISDGTGVGTIADDDGPGTPPPGGVGPKITTGAGPGGGPHIRVFQPNGADAGVGFMDGGETTGKRVARGDLDGDGIDEIITGSGPNSPAVVSVYSATGTLRASAFAYANGNFYGGIFVATGDVNKDGKDEVVTAAGPGGGPHIRVWQLSGNSLTGNDGFMAYSNWHGGASVAVGDVNKDGFEDIITGAGAGGGPHVKAFNGFTPVELFGFMAFDTFNGGVNVAAGDLDGDGFAEIVAGAGPGGGPHLRLFNHDGTLRNSGIFAGNSAFRGGINVAVGDLDGVAGTGEIIVGAQTLATSVRGYKADLSSLQGTNFDAYPGFGGGVYIAIGRS